MRLRARRPCRVLVPGAGPRPALRARPGDADRAELQVHARIVRSAHRRHRLRARPMVHGHGGPLCPGPPSADGKDGVALSARAPAVAPIGTRGAEAVTLLREAWERTDRLFALVRRRRCWRSRFRCGSRSSSTSATCRRSPGTTSGGALLGQAPLREPFDVLFERGIDPVGVDEYRPAAVWPEATRCSAYRDEARRRLADLRVIRDSPGEVGGRQRSWCSSTS